MEMNQKLTDNFYKQKVKDLVDLGLLEFQAELYVARFLIDHLNLIFKDCKKK